MNIHENKQSDNQPKDGVGVNETSSKQVTGAVSNQEKQAVTDPTRKKKPFYKKSKKKAKPAQEKPTPVPVVKKEVDISPLKDLKDLIALNHLNNTSGNKPGQFSKHIPDIKTRIFVPKPEEEGITHINVSFNAKNKFGQLLDIYSYSTFNTPELGSFNSIGGLKHFLLNGQDVRFRTLAGRTCQNEARKLKETPVPNLQHVLAEATWFKVIQNDFIMNEMINNNLPFHSYFIRDNLVVDTGLNGWYVKVLSEIRRVIQINNKSVEDAIAAGTKAEDVEMVYPNFDFLDKTKK